MFIWVESPAYVKTSTASHCYFANIDDFEVSPRLYYHRLTNFLLLHGKSAVNLSMEIRSQEFLTVFALFQNFIKQSCLDISFRIVNIYLLQSPVNAISLNKQDSDKHAFDPIWRGQTFYLIYLALNRRYCKVVVDVTR